MWGHAWVPSVYVLRINPLFALEVQSFTGAPGGFAGVHRGRPAVVKITSDVVLFHGFKVVLLLGEAKQRLPQVVQIDLASPL